MSLHDLALALNRNLGRQLKDLNSRLSRMAKLGILTILDSLKLIADFRLRLRLNVPVGRVSRSLDKVHGRHVGNVVERRGEIAIARHGGLDPVEQLSKPIKSDTLYTLYTKRCVFVGKNITRAQKMNFVIFQSECDESGWAHVRECSRA